VLKGDGHGKFRYLTPQESGIFIPGEVRDAKIIRDAKGNIILLIGRNNSSMMAYKKH
jgi:hypothetical protein